MAESHEKLTLYTTRLLEKKQEAKEIFSFKFEIPAGLTWHVGSHFHFAFPSFMKGAEPDKTLVRAFSLMSMNDEQYLGFTTRIKEDCSPYKKKLMALHAGDEMTLFKISHHMELKREKKPLVFLSMGVGLATFRPFLISLQRKRDNIPFVTNITIDSKHANLYQSEREMSQHDCFCNHCVRTRKELYAQIDNCLAMEQSVYYIVGSDSFIQDLCRYLINHSVDKSHIMLDKKMEERQQLLNKSCTIDAV